MAIVIDKLQYSASNIEDKLKELLDVNNPSLYIHQKEPDSGF